jgi:hypothetical protein
LLTLSIVIKPLVPNKFISFSSYFLFSLKKKKILDFVASKVRRAKGTGQGYRGAAPTSART